jgi:glycerophosphoryl diester phosphodiesterase
MKLTLVLWLAMFGQADPAAPQAGAHPQSGGRALKVVAHRGLLLEAPENTLANFRACLELRLGFEFDVRRTKDGQLVCLHDDTVDRTSDGKGRVTDLTLDQLRRLDAGRWFSPEFAGERIPTIDEVFALAAAHRGKAVLLAVDIKAEDPAVEGDLVKLARKHELLDRLVFIGRTIEHAEVRQRLKDGDSKAQVARLVGAAAELPAATRDNQADWLYLRFIPGADDVRRVHAAGKRLFLAGPLVAGREPENWRAAAALGFDGVLTDHPLDLRRTIAPPPLDPR